VKQSDLDFVILFIKNNMQDKTDCEQTGRLPAATKQDVLKKVATSLTLLAMTGLKHLNKINFIITGKIIIQ